jgi:hypothetical protein
MDTPLYRSAAECVGLIGTSAGGAKRLSAGKSCGVAAVVGEGRRSVIIQWATREGAGSGEIGMQAAALARRLRLAERDESGCKVPNGAVSAERRSSCSLVA